MNNNDNDEHDLRILLLRQKALRSISSNNSANRSAIHSPTDVPMDDAGSNSTESQTNQFSEDKTDAFAHKVITDHQKTDSPKWCSIKPLSESIYEQESEYTERQNNFGESSEYAERQNHFQQESSEYSERQNVFQQAHTRLSAGKPLLIDYLINLADQHCHKIFVPVRLHNYLTIAKAITKNQIEPQDLAFNNNQLAYSALTKNHTESQDILERDLLPQERDPLTLSLWTLLLEMTEHSRLTARWSSPVPLGIYTKEVETVLADKTSGTQLRQLAQAILNDKLPHSLAFEPFWRDLWRLIVQRYTELELSHLLQQLLERQKSRMTNSKTSDFIVRMPEILPQLLSQSTKAITDGPLVSPLTSTAVPSKPSVKNQCEALYEAMQQQKEQDLTEKPDAKDIYLEALPVHSIALGKQLPRYFAKTMASFHWNRYNQLHYTSDSPPPKVINGYRFTLFYDLLQQQQQQQKQQQKEGQKISLNYQMQQIPEYRLDRGTPECPEGMAKLTFVAPSWSCYADISFWIVDKEWDRNEKFGFVSSYDGGILRLSFHFKKIRGRR